MNLTLELTGTKPMIQHNGRLANPMDPLTRELKSITGKRKKTDEDIAQIAFLEARAGLYETTDGLVGLPNENVWACIFEAAKAFKRGKDISRGLMIDPDIEPVLIDGEHKKAETFLEDEGRVFYKSVKVGTSRVMRSRPILTTWQSSHSFELLTDVMDPKDLGPIFERAGRLVGIGDWRPRYGTFEVAVSS